MNINVISSNDEERYLAAMGLQNLKPEERQHALLAITQILNMNVLERLAELLSDQQMAGLEAVSEAGEDAVNSWLKQNVPNLNRIVEKEALKLRDEAIGDLNSARGVGK